MSLWSLLMGNTGNELPSLASEFAPRGFTSLIDTYGRETLNKALKLAEGCDPAMNLMPYIQIVLDAERLGLEVTRRQP